MTKKGFNPEQAMVEFARARIFPEKDLGERIAFPFDLWAEMGALGLLDPDRYAGQAPKGTPSEGPGRCRTLTRTARAMAEAGGNLGLTLSFIIHHLTAHYILGPARTGQAGLRQGLKTGRAFLSFAVSEPGVGGHPKFMEARAEEREDGFALFGEKTFLTNGPIADAFVVIAVTGKAGGRKDFSAFLVPRAAEGLTVLPPMEMKSLRPSPHGAIQMVDCRVGKEALLGCPGQAYPDLVLWFRQLEDALMTGAVAGTMAHLLTAAAGVLRQAGKGDEADLKNLGQLRSMAGAAALLSDQVAKMADQGGKDPHGVYLFLRTLAPEFLSLLDQTLGSLGLDRQARTLAADLGFAARIGSKVLGLKVKKLGQAVLAGP